MSHWRVLNVSETAKCIYLQNKNVTENTPNCRHLSVENKIAATGLTKDSITGTQIKVKYLK